MLIVIYYLFFQYESLGTLYRIVLIAIYITYIIIEVIRLYLGYVGNLMERVRCITVLSLYNTLRYSTGLKEAKTAAMNIF